MSYETFIAGKHLMHRRKTGFISMISMISIMGVGVGVMALIVVLAVMSGFDRELKSKIVSVQPHLRIEQIGGVQNPQAAMEAIRAHQIPGLRNLSTFIEGQGILKSEANATGIVVKGLDYENDDLSIYRRHLLYGNPDLRDKSVERTERWFFFFKKKVRKTRGSMMIGEGLANLLHVRIGDEVYLISPFQDRSGG